MLEKTKKQKGFLTEEDISSLLQRYTATTVLALLQEVAQVADVKIDWDALVRKTTTGITNAREYQMLWRHLAYHHGLLDKLDDGAEPLDDDSDLEYELEAFPAVSAEASAEAAACVKVLIASGVSSDSNLLNGSTVEAPLTINIPNGQTSRNGSENPLHGISMNGTNITVPVAVQKQPLSTVTTAEGFDTHGPASNNLPPRRKRKPWSEAEDLELIAAVQKCGEGNWANILKGDFKGDRTASQLSQRWSIIRKRQGIMVGNGSQLSEAQLAARRAMSLALNMPMGDNLKASCPISTAGHGIVSVGPNSGGASSNPSSSVAADVASGGGQSRHLQDSVPLKPHVAPKKPSQKPSAGQDSMVKAAAVAAGARIATPSDAATLLKAAQSKTAVHIVPGGGGPAIKSSVPGSTNGLPSNVHFIRTGLVSHSTGPPNASRPGTQQTLGHSLRAASQALQPNQVVMSSRLNASDEASNATTSGPAAELEVKTKQELVQENQTATPSSAQNEKPVGDLAVSANSSLPQPVHKDPTPVSGNPLIEKAEDNQTSLSGDAPKGHRQEDQNSVLANASSIQVQEKLANCPNQGMAVDSASGNKAEVECENIGGQGPELEKCKVLEGSNEGKDPSKALARTVSGRE